MPIYTINKQELYVRDAGPPDGPVAVLIHGWSSSWFTWSPLLDALGTRFRCLAVDLPGYGRSPEPIEPPTIAGYADLLAALIERVSDRPVVVLGHSMGGQIGMTLALRHPILVERLVLLNPAVSGRLSTFIRIFIAPHVFLERQRWLGQMLSFLETTPLSYQRQLIKPILFAERARVSQEASERIRADARRAGGGWVRAACYRAMLAGDLRGKLSQIEAPALVIWGAEDNTVPLRDAGVVADEWPLADLRLIPNAGHWPHFEQPTLTLRYLAAFLGLPLLTNLPDQQDAHRRVLDVDEVAQFLTNSELATDLTEAQRLRIAGQCEQRQYMPGEQIAVEATLGDTMFIVREGQITVVLRTPQADGSFERQEVATLKAGQVAGEMALLQNTTRAADLEAGPQGTTVLAIQSRQLWALFDDDPQLGFRMLRNLARSLAQRLRVQNWQLQLMQQSELAQESIGKKRI